MKKLYCNVYLPVVAAFLSLVPADHVFSQISLGSNAGFTLFTSTGAVANTGTTYIFGHIGTNSGDVSGFGSPSVVSGNTYDTDATTSQSAADLMATCMQINNLTITHSGHAVVFGRGETLTPGVYSTSAATSVDGNLILDAQGNTNAIFVFIITGEFTTTAGASVSLQNGAAAQNIFWKATGAIAMATNTIMKGTVISNDGAVSMGAGGDLEGRLLSTAGALSTYQTTTYLPAAVTLAANLTRFYGRYRSGSVELAWLTSGQANLLRFDVERSVDGLHFMRRTTVMAVQHSSDHAYSWNDFVEPGSTCYYRLKLIEQNGNFKYSTVITMGRDAVKSVSVFPSPVTGGRLNVIMNGQAAGEYTFSIYSAGGTMITRKTFVHDGSSVAVVQVSYSNGPGGICYAKLASSSTVATTILLLIQ